MKKIFTATLVLGTLFFAVSNAHAEEPTLSVSYPDGPIPIITTLLTTRSEVETSLADCDEFSRNNLLAIHNCPIISATVRLRLKPCLPVEQKVQASAQPT